MCVDFHALKRSLKKPVKQIGKLPILLLLRVLHTVHMYMGMYVHMFVFFHAPLSLLQRSVANYVTDDFLATDGPRENPDIVKPFSY